MVTWLWKSNHRKFNALPANACRRTVHFCGRISSLAVARTEKIASIAGVELLKLIFEWKIELARIRCRI